MWCRLCTGVIQSKVRVDKMAVWMDNSSTHVPLRSLPRRARMSCLAGSCSSLSRSLLRAVRRCASGTVSSKATLVCLWKVVDLLSKRSKAPQVDLDSPISTSAVSI